MVIRVNLFSSLEREYQDTKLNRTIYTLRPFDDPTISALCAFTPHFLNHSF